MHAPNRSFDQLSRLDPTGQIDLEDCSSVEKAVCAILDRHYAGRYDIDLLHCAIADTVRAYRGDYPGLLHCDTPYHDLRHALETALTTARLLDGYATSHAPDSEAGIDANHALFGVLIALFHDIGLLRRTSEANLSGPALTPVHEERGVDFVRAYLCDTTLSPLLSEAKLLMATRLAFNMPESWTPEEQMLASLIATADVLSQFSDRCYLEKCRDFLFFEFSAFGLAGKPDTLYPDRKTLLAETPAFVDRVMQKRLDEEFQGVRRHLRTHMAGADPWEDAIQRSLGHLKTLLDGTHAAPLRRQPKPFFGIFAEPFCSAC